MTPGQVALTLRSYRAVVEAAVFAMDGAILSHIGDGVVAAFGLTGASRNAARSALICARRIANDWTRTPLAIGVDFGAARMGLVGEGRSMSLLALGDAIDAAAALQWATREAHTNILIGERARSSMIEDDVELVRALAPCRVADIDAWRLHAT
jgi:adenylate cyclase